MPDWYALVTAARFMGVPPWTLFEQPIVWQAWALEAKEVDDYERMKMAGVIK